jgi:hypothetical protein
MGLKGNEAIQQCGRRERFLVSSLSKVGCQELEKMEVLSWSSFSFASEISI